ncbi:DUF5077 domain-containing protein [Undibacterium jejuense]|uniref:DUF5077 domain-containing protein n=1 Tax=Undibacterium jejuense TaxID=1344949 RepID=A0A923HFN8_9BURK|nr:DUF5077 domain-containing protein [Undibacterium jejuense]MBC3863677.1 DUF5077 domain-containing protein [Undibacterium jejuense]
MKIVFRVSMFLLMSQCMTSFAQQNSSATINPFGKVTPHAKIAAASCTPTSFTPTATIALSGNGFITQAQPNATESIDSGAGATGLHAWTSNSTVISTYFRVSNPGELKLALLGSLNGATSSTVSISLNGQSSTVDLKGTETKSYPVCSFNVSSPGYVKVDLQGVTKVGSYFGDITALQVAGTASNGLIYANDPNNYYWSRRGPSVHLAYTVPDSTEYFYSEVTVPKGQDQIGSYYMANGFGEGYFGIQVKETGRIAIFSVWNPLQGKTTAKQVGTGVTVRTFDGEGTGGQAAYPYNWITGNTYKFITKITPNTNGSTDYSAWLFAPELNTWKFIATWNRPNTKTYHNGVYSFLENFIDSNGYLGRSALYGNQWARSTTGVWTEITSASYTGDPTATNKQRMDYAGGLQNGLFFLKNGGFFNDYVTSDQQYNRPATRVPPAVDVKTLPIQ